LFGNHSTHSLPLYVLVHKEELGMGFQPPTGRAVWIWFKEPAHKSFIRESD